VAIALFLGRWVAPAAATTDHNRPLTSCWPSCRRRPAVAAGSVWPAVAGLVLLPHATESQIPPSNACAGKFPLSAGTQWRRGRARVALCSAK